MGGAETGREAEVVAGEICGGGGMVYLWSRAGYARRDARGRDSRVGEDARRGQNRGRGHVSVVDALGAPLRISRDFVCNHSCSALLIPLLFFCVATLNLVLWDHYCLHLCDNNCDVIHLTAY